MTVKQKTFRIFVEIDNKQQVKLELDHDEVTGAEIKTRAEVSQETDLALRKQGELTLVTNGETITIQNGDHFIVFPPGTIS